MSKPQTIDDYIANYPQNIQYILQKIRKIGKEIVPNGAESISYGIPTIKLNGKYVVYFAAYAKHVSLHPIIHDDPELDKEIAPYKKGRGTLQFPLSKPIPYGIIREVVKSLLKENLKRTGKY